MQTNIVKILSSESGSGFMYLPSNASDDVYVFTARHSVTEKLTGIPKAKASISIVFFDPANSVYNLSDDDVILYGNNNHTEDFAVIIIKRAAIPETIEIGGAYGLAALTGKETSSFVTGIPKVVQNKVQRTLYLGRILGDKDYAEQVQVEISDPISDEYNADNLVEGYSGSPLFITSGSEHFAFGIFSKYEEQTKRILAVDLRKASQLLKEAGYPELVLMRVETEENALTDIMKLKLNTSRVLDRVRDEVGTVKLGRADLTQDLVKKIKRHAFLVVTGNAGVGKSALVKKVLSDLADEYEVIVFQGEQLDKPTISEIFQDGPFKLAHDFEAILDSYGMKPSKILLIDSIEKILETSNAGTIIDFFGLLNKRKDLKIVLTCRSYALEQLKIGFLQQFLEFNMFEIPILSGDELKELVKHYPAISTLLSNPSLERILKIPFNLDKAVLVSGQIIGTVINSEVDFKRIMWEYVIEDKQKETDASQRKSRGDTFAEVALRRAKAMTAYTDANGLDRNVLEKLVHDNIVEWNAARDQVAASHDIYEDWALTRYIENSYQGFLMLNSTVETFFESIGFAAAVRRAFRIWISEKLQQVDYNTNELLQKIISHKTLQHFWKDEVIIAIMQSPYSGTFLNNNKGLLFSEDFGLFKRTMLLLNVACQQPDLSNIQAYKNEDKPQLYRSYHLKPVGQGWRNFVDFIFENIKDLTGLYPLLINFLLQWEKSIGFFDIPPESRNAALIIIEYFKFSPGPSPEGYTPRKENVTDCIHLLFRLASVVPDEVRVILETALKFTRKRRNADKDEVSEKIAREVLSCLYGAEVTRLFPELVMKIAEKEWFYHKPTEEELRKALEGTPFKSIPRGPEKEEEFGIRSIHIFPASPFQVPIINLLHSDTEKALEFITRLFNHSLDAFLESDFLSEDSEVFSSDPRKEINYTLPDGTTVVQHGTLALWLMFRGTYIATPYLLQSVLMALEKWMLQMAEFANKPEAAEKYGVFEERLMLTYDYLLKNSRSVATTSVLVSVATAYPDLLAGKILPILTVKDFYKWDLVRCHHEKRALSPLGSSALAEVIQKERYQSNQLPHRQDHLEVLFLKLSFGHYANTLIGILDNFYAEEPKENDWKFSLNRMDRRKLEIIEEKENGFLVKTKIDEELLPQAEIAQKQMEDITPLNRATNWARHKLDKKAVEDDTLDQWRIHYNNILSSSISGKPARLYRQPTLIAAVGVRDYFHQLSSDELNWCIDMIFQVIDYEIKRSFNPHDLGLDSPFGAFETGPAFVGLCDLVSKASGDILLRAKELIFASLLFVNNNIDQKELIKKFRSDLWVTNPDFSVACIAGLIEYSAIANLRMRVNLSTHWIGEGRETPKKHFSSKILSFLIEFYKIVASLGKYKRKADKLKERQKWISEYEAKLIGIIENVVLGGQGVNFDEININELPAYHLFKAMTLMPAASATTTVQKFTLLMIAYINENIDNEGDFNNDKIHYELLQQFEKYIAIFLLNQPNTLAIEVFKKLFTITTDAGGKSYYPHKQKDFLGRCLDEMISQVIQDESFSNSFWLLWNYFSTEFRNGKIRFESKLLLDYPYWNSDIKDWPPLRGKKDFYEAIVPSLTKYKSLAKLLSGIGFTALMPEGLLWLSKPLEKMDFTEKDLKYFIEKLAINIFYDKKVRNIVRNNTALRQAYIAMLDKLIDQSSSPAFLIRENFISVN